MISFSLTQYLNKHKKDLLNCIRYVPRMRNARALCAEASGTKLTIACFVLNKGLFI